MRLPDGHFIGLLHGAAFQAKTWVDQVPTMQTLCHYGLRVIAVDLPGKQPTTLQSIINAKLSQHRFWHCHENRLIKTVQTIPHNL